MQSKAAAISQPDTKTMHDAPFIQSKQIRLNDNFRQYLETSLISKKVFPMGIRKTLPKIFRTTIIFVIF